MARATLTPSALVANGSLADPAGTANVVANGLNIPGNNRSNPSLFLRVSNASGGAGNLIVRAGSQPSAISSGQGDLTVSVANSATTWFGPFDSSRFQQSDGSVNVDTSVVMTVTAFTLDGRRI
jgi:hypothetical protein